MGYVHLMFFSDWSEFDGLCASCVFSVTGLNLMGYVRLVFFSDWSEFDGLCASFVFQGLV